MSLSLAEIMSNRVPVKFDVQINGETKGIELDVNPSAFTPLLEAELAKMRNAEGSAGATDSLVGMVVALVPSWSITVPREVVLADVREEFALLAQARAEAAPDLPALPGGGAGQFEEAEAATSEPLLDAKGRTLEKALAAVPKADAEGMVPWPVTPKSVRKLPYYIIVPMMEAVVLEIAPKTETDES